MEKREALPIRIWIFSFFWQGKDLKGAKDEPKIGFAARLGLPARVWMYHV